MADWLMKVIKAEAKHLIELAAHDAELRADLRALAEQILAATEEPRGESEPDADSSDSDPSVVAQGTQPESTTEEVVEPVRELTLGRSRPAKIEPGIGAATVRSAEAPRDELAEIERRSRWKSEVARWAA